MSHMESLPKSQMPASLHGRGLWRRRLLNFCILGYLALQIFLPLNGCRRSALETRGNFSWNMYARIFRCRYRYEWVSSYGQVSQIKVTRYFNRPSGVTKALHSDTLPLFHQWLCNTIHAERPQGALRASVSVSDNGAPYVALIPRSTWICDEPSTGSSPP